MKKFLTLVVAMAMVIPSMAIGRNDGSTKANAIDFDWDNGVEHVSGTKWYRVDLAPLYEEESPSLTLYLTNPSNAVGTSVDVSMQATVAGQSESKDYTIAARQYKTYTANATSLVRMKQTEIYLTLTSTGKIKLSAKVFETADLEETCKDARTLAWGTVTTQAPSYSAWWKVSLKPIKDAADQDASHACDHCAVRFAGKQGRHSVRQPGLYSLFQSGLVAMAFKGSWSMGTYADIYGDRLGVVPLPIMKERKTISHGLSWVGAASTQHPEEVKKFLAFMGSYDAQAQTADVVIPAYEGCDALWAAKFEGYNTEAFLGAANQGWAVPLPAADKNTQEIFVSFDNYMAEILSGGNVEENLAKMQDEFNGLLAD